jgi:hypothetical protein
MQTSPVWTRERDDAIARLKTTSSGDVAAAGAPGAPADAGKGKPQGYAAFAKMFESEEGRKMMKSQGAMMTRMMYSDLARVLKLSPQDAEQVMAMLNDRQSAMSEGQFKFMGEGKFDEATAKQMGEQSAEVKKDYDAKLKGLLGEQKFQEMQDYERTLGDRMALTQYETQFSAAGVPLKLNSAMRCSGSWPVSERIPRHPSSTTRARIRRKVLRHAR